MSRDWLESLGLTLAVVSCGFILGLAMFILILFEIWLYALLVVGGFFVLWVIIHFGIFFGRGVFWWLRGYRNGQWS